MKPPKKARKPTKRGAALVPKIDAKTQTINWLLDGKRIEEIAKLLRETYPDENPTKLLRGASDHFATVAESDPLVIRGWCLEALREMYRRMVEIGDYPSALRAIKELMAYAKQCSPLEREARGTAEAEPSAKQPAPLMPSVPAT